MKKGELYLKATELKIFSIAASYQNKNRQGKFHAANSLVNKLTSYIKHFNFLSTGKQFTLSEFLIDFVN